MRAIERSEILPIGDYEMVRPHFRARVIAEKKPRRVELGEHIAAVFENRDSVLLQIQEMLRTERITAEPAILHEIATYNELVPGPRQLSVTHVRADPRSRELRDRLLVEWAGLDRLLVDALAVSRSRGKLARAEGIRLGSLDEGPLDVAFDGADEVDARLRLTKGLGGAMLRERVVAAEASRFVVLVTAEKVVDRLGARSPLPVEVVPFALAPASRRLEQLGERAVLRKKPDGGAPFVTDNGNLVVDLYSGPGGWEDPEALDADVRRVPGVVDTGFFFRMASLVIVGGAEGTRVISRRGPPPPTAPKAPARPNGRAWPPRWW
jgi:ribose 5-phosphate isomerase A